MFSGDDTFFFGVLARSSAGPGEALDNLFLTPLDADVLSDV